MRIAIFFAAAMAPVVLCAAGEPAGRSPAFDAYVDGVVSALMEEHSIPGLIISVVRDGTVLLSKGYGIADARGASVDPSKTLFRIGSVTKTFTWIAVMQLVEQNRLDLHADVNDYLEVLQIPPWNGRPLTLYDIMAHRSGFEDTTGRHLFETDPNRVIPFREWLERYLPARVRPPGEALAYSNYAATLAGAVVENVSSMPLHEYLDIHVFSRLGMQNTTLLEPLGDWHAVPALDGSRAAGFSEGFVRRNGVRRAYGFEYISNIAPAGAGSSTADDMAQYMLGLLDDADSGDRPLLRADTFGRMRQRSYPGDQRMNAFAHGFIAGSANGYSYWGHGGITTTFGTTMLLWPDLEFGVFISINQRDGAGAISRVPLLLQRRLFAEPAPTQPVERAVEAFPEPQFGGNYLTNRRPYTTLERFNSLTWGHGRVDIAEDGHLLYTAGDETSAWYGIAPLVFRNAQSGAVMTFDADAEGNIVRLNDPGGYVSLEKLAFVETPRFLYLALVVGALFAAATLTSVVRGWRRRSFVRPRFAPDWFAAAMAVAVLLAGVCFLAALSSRAGGEWPPPALLALVWLSNASALLAVGLLASTLVLWGRFGIGAPSRFLYLTLALAGVVMTVALNEWNLAGVPL